ncbi:MAG: PQQ-binding-like beta-propeller repeat protein [Proteobacteria bacterium]|nr:PQQ-binding-like beta-propeller repeat protein [Pseudomonadota bacterium]MDA1059141.1 PQQ-binding-like beta-propeller repeat protein [Pseudomonadota bacterium]
MHRWAVTVRDNAAAQTAAMGRAGLLAVAGVTLAACGLFSGYVAPPLPGERISVLSLEQTLVPDPGIQDLEVRLPRPVVNAEWTQSGGSATKAMHHLAIGEAPARRWRTSIGAGSNRDRRLTAPPVISGGLIYAMDASGQVGAFDASSGDRRWRFDVVPSKERSGALGGGLAVVGETLFITTGYGDVITLTAATGAPIWRAPLNVPLASPPTVSGGLLFVVSNDNQTFALRVEDGSAVWNHVGIAETAGLVGAGSPATANGVVVVPYSSGELVALRADNGQVLWTDTLSRGGPTTALGEITDINGHPVIDRGTVYAVGHSGRMVANDLTSGARLWTQDISGSGSPWIAGDFIYMVTSGSELIALSRQDGRIRWVTELPRYRNPETLSGPITWGGPVLGSDRLIIVSSTGDAVAVSPYTGRMLGNLRLADAVYLPPVLAGESLFFLTDDGALVAYR